MSLSKNLTMLAFVLSVGLTGCTTTGADGTKRTYVPGINGPISGNVPIGGGIDRASHEINKARGMTSNTTNRICNIRAIVRNDSAGAVHVRLETFSKPRYRQGRLMTPRTLISETPWSPMKTGQVANIPSQLYQNAETRIVARRYLSRDDQNLSFGLCRQGGEWGKEDVIGFITDFGPRGVEIRRGDPALVRRR